MDLAQSGTLILERAKWDISVGRLSELKRKERNRSIKVRRWLFFGVCDTRHWSIWVILAADNMQNMIDERSFGCMVMRVQRHNRFKLHKISLIMDFDYLSIASFFWQLRRCRPSGDCCLFHPCWVIVMTILIVTPKKYTIKLYRPLTRLMQIAFEANQTKKKNRISI